MSGYCPDCEGYYIINGICGRSDCITNDADILDGGDVVNNIAEMLMQADAAYLTVLYNSLCSDDIEYLGDSVWRRKI